jgi:hypothetical protein
MKNSKWAVYFLALASLFLILVPGNALAQIGGDEPCCNNQANGGIIGTDLTTSPSDGTVFFINDQALSEPGGSSIPASTDAITQNWTVPEPRLNPRYR